MTAKRKLIIIGAIATVLLSGLLITIAILCAVLESGITYYEGMFVMHSKYSESAEQYRSIVYSSLESFENRENKRTDDDYYTQYTDVMLGIIEIETKGLGIDVCNIEKYSEGSIAIYTASESIRRGVQRLIHMLDVADLVIEPSYTTVFIGGEDLSGDSGSSVSSSGSYEEYINVASQTYGVPVAMIKAVIKQESGGNPNARSAVGAGGLMQLMPGTAEGLGVTDVYDPYQNIMGGTKYLSQLYQKFGDWQLTLAAYNAGEGNVRKYGGIPPFKETQNYVLKVMQSYKAGGGGDFISTSASVSTSLIMTDEQKEKLKIVLEGFNLGEEYTKSEKEYNINAAYQYIVSHELTHRDEKYAEKIMLYLNRENEGMEGIITGSIDADDLGEFIRPISKANSAELSSPFGYRIHPITGKYKLHTGIDLAASAGVPISASKGGTVIFSGYNSGGYGYMVKIDHGSGIQTWYAHCSALLVKTGDVVSQGAVIAKVGSTGSSTGNHLHFEVRIGGSPVDPMKYISY